MGRVRRCGAPWRSDSGGGPHWALPNGGEGLEKPLRENRCYPSGAMSDDDEDALVDDAPRASQTEVDAPPEPKKKGEPQSAAQLAIRVVLGTSGLLLVIGFFLPWLHFGELTNISGMDLVV